MDLKNATEKSGTAAINAKWCQVLNEQCVILQWYFRAISQMVWEVNLGLIVVPFQHDFSNYNRLNSTKSEDKTWIENQIKWFTSQFWKIVIQFIIWKNLVMHFLGK